MTMWLPRFEKLQENEPEKSFEQIVNELLRIGLKSYGEDKGMDVSE